MIRKFSIVISILWNQTNRDEIGNYTFRWVFWDFLKVSRELIFFQAFALAQDTAEKPAVAGDDGKWTKCDEPAAVDNGKVRCKKDTCIVKCDDGFMLDGAGKSKAGLKLFFKILFQFILPKIIIAKYFFEFYSEKWNMKPIKSA